MEAKKILVVEDDKYLSGAYVTKLTKIGFDVRLAMNGVEALKMLDEFMPDLILLDLVMPRKDGFDTLTDIRANPKWKHIPVIVASNLGQQDDIDRVMKLGAQDYVLKSEMTVDDFIRKVKMVLHVYN